MNCFKAILQRPVSSVVTAVVVAAVVAVVVSHEDVQKSPLAAHK